jgi:hypothetical protein
VKLFVARQRDDARRRHNLSARVTILSKKTFCEIYMPCILSGLASWVDSTH